MLYVIGSQRGIGLIEALASIGLVASLSLIMSTTIVSGIKGSRLAESNIVIARLQAEIQSTVHNQSMCGTAFKDGSGAPIAPDLGGTTPVSQIVTMANGEPLSVASVGSEIAPGIIISKLELERANSADNGQPLSIADSFEAGYKSVWFVLNIDVKRKGILGSADKSLRPISFEAVINWGTGEITDCIDISPTTTAQPDFHFLWVADENYHDSESNCPPGYLDTTIVDDSDIRHNLGEDNKDGLAQRLCASGITDAQWIDENLDCPVGYVDTFIGDDSDSLHATWESNGWHSCTQRLCVQGITTAQWMGGQCQLGWTSTTIMDPFEDNDSHCMSREYGENHGEMVVLCVQ